MTMADITRAKKKGNENTKRKKSQRAKLANDKRIKQANGKNSSSKKSIKHKSDKGKIVAKRTKRIACRSFASISPSSKSIFDPDEREIHELYKQYYQHKHLFDPEYQELDEEFFEKLSRDHDLYCQSYKKPITFSTSRIIESEKLRPITEFIPSKNDKEYWKTAFDEVINLENNPNYLTDDRLFKWAEIISNAIKFRHLVIYISVALGLPSTKCLNQGEYFERYFRFTAQDVSKSVLHVSTLLFLYFRVGHMNDLESRSQLFNIGDENNHVVNCYAKIRAEHGDDRVVAVFKECSRQLEQEPTIKRITGTLVKKVNDNLTHKDTFNSLISKGASDEYINVELPDLSKSENSTSPETTSSNSPKDKANELLEGLKKHDMSIQELHHNIGAYSSEDLQEILKSVENLYQTARTLLTRE